MKLNQVSCISFNGKIIDAHAHIGNWRGTKYQLENLDTFSKQPLSNGDTIEKMIVSNLSCIDKNGMKNELDGNLEMLDIAKNSKIAPLAVCEPKTGSVDNIIKLFDQNPNRFIGLKFHPDGHEIMASDKSFIPYLKFAKERKLPCLFHCGINWENGHLADASKAYSAPEKIYKAAKKIPDTPVVLAHLGAGGEQVHKRAINVLLDSIKTGKANLYADISWVDVDNPSKPTIVALIKKLQNTKKGDMTHKLLFGSDAPLGEFFTGKSGLNGKQFYEKSILDIKAAIKDNFGDDADEIIDKIFYKNADELFFKRNWVKDTQKFSKTKIGAIIAASITALTGITLLFINKKKIVCPQAKELCNDTIKQNNKQTSVSYNV